MERAPDWDTVPKLRDLLDEWLETEPESPAHCSDLELDDDYTVERDPTPDFAPERARRP
jgi:hypothetical protein